MKKHFYFFSSIILLNSFFCIEKAKSYDFDKGFIANISFSRDGQTTNGLITNIDIDSYSTDIAYTGTDVFGAYWYGVGIGIGETLCYSTANGYIANNVARNMMRDYRNIYRGGEDFRSKNFEEGIQLAIDGYPGCRL